MKFNQALIDGYSMSVSLKTFAESTGYTVKKVKKHLREMERKNLIRFEIVRGNVLNYTLLEPNIWGVPE